MIDIRSATDIAELCSNTVSESQVLEFKQELPKSNDRGKAEFLKDVTSFANADGGQLVFGISELKGAASAVSRIEVDDIDAELRRLSQILDSGIEPRLSGLKIEYVEVEQFVVFVVKIPKSFDAPHRYLFNGHSKFVTRNGTHVSEYSYDQLRSAFDKSLARSLVIDQNWQETIDQAESGKTWRPIVEGPICICQIAPLSSAEKRQIVDLEKANENYAQLMFSDWGGASSRFNYEGLAVYAGYSEPELAGLVQVNRTGTITAYRRGGLVYENKEIMPSVRIGDFFVSAVRSLLEYYKLLGISGPAILNCAVVRIGNYEFASNDRYGFSEAKRVSLDRLILPQTWINELSVSADVDKMMKPNLDVLWQSFGWASCPEFNVEGRWSPK